MFEFNGKIEKERHPIGSFPGTLIRVIDLGTQEAKQKDGTIKMQRQIRLTFESSEKMNDGRPFLVDTFPINATMWHEKAKLRVMFESWRGKKFTQDEAMNFSVRSAVGKSGLMNIVENNGYSNFSGITKLPSGLVAPPIVNSTYFFNLADYDDELFKSFPTWIQDKIKKSPEYQSLFEGKKEESIDDDVSF